MARRSLDEIYADVMQQHNPGVPSSLGQIAQTGIPSAGQTEQTASPQMGNFVATDTSSEPHKGLLGKIGSFIGQATGISGTGKALNAPNVASQQQGTVTELAAEAQRLFDQAKMLKVGNPQRKQLLLQAKAITDAMGGLADKSVKDVPTNAQGLASVGKVGLTMASFGTGAGATMGGRLAYGAATGGAFGGLDAAEKGGGVKDVLKGAAIGGATGLAVSGVMEGIKYAASHWATTQFSKGARFTPNQLTDKNVKEAIAYGTSQGKVFKNAADAVEYYKGSSNALEGQIQEKLAGSTAKIKPRDLITKIAENMNKEGYVKSADDVFEEIVGHVENGERLLRKPSLSVADANLLKKAISSNINWKPGTWFATLKPGNQQLLVSTRAVFADAIKEAAPGSRSLFQEQMYNIILRDGFQVAAEKGVVGGGLMNTAAGGLIAGGLGIGAGAATGGVGTVIGAVATKALHTTFGRTLAAYGLSNIAPIVLKLAPQEQQIVMQAFLNVAGANNEQDGNPVIQ